MIHIKNYSKVFTNKEIIKILDCLPTKYKKLDINLIILKNKWQSFLYIRCVGIDHIKDIFNKLTNGASLEANNKIFIYPFNINSKDKKDIKILKCKLTMINVIYHEIRHQWQKINNPMMEKEKMYLSLSDKNYNKQKSEKDAIGFSKKIIQNNYDNISIIVGCSDWYIK